MLAKEPRRDTSCAHGSIRHSVLSVKGSTPADLRHARSLMSAGLITRTCLKRPFRSQGVRPHVSWPRAGAGVVERGRWPRPDLAEFHLKLISRPLPASPTRSASSTRNGESCFGDCERFERSAMAEPDHSDAGLLLEGITLRLQADSRWLEACERAWTDRRSHE